MIYIIIPVFNRWDYTKSCLISLSKQTNKAFKIIVVDHGSTDDTRKCINTDFPEVILLTGDQNMWWTAATNLGVKYAMKQTDMSYILTLNNDTVASSNYIEELYKSSNILPSNSLIGSCAIDIETGKILFAGEVENWLTETSIFIIDDPELIINDHAKVTRFPGRGLLIPKSVFNIIGIFDENVFPHYWADYDFSAKAYRNSFPIFCALRAKLGIFPDASAANQIKMTKTVKGYFDHLFSIRGAANLKNFYRYGLRNCPGFALPSFLVLGTARRLLGYWIK